MEFTIDDSLLHEGCFIRHEACFIRLRDGGDTYSFGRKSIYSCNDFCFQIGIEDREFKMTRKIKRILNSNRGRYFNDHVGYVFYDRHDCERALEQLRELLDPHLVMLKLTE